MLVCRRGNTQAIRIIVIGGVLATFGAFGTARGEGLLPIRPRASGPVAVEPSGAAVNQAGGPQLVTLVRDGRKMTTVRRYPRKDDAPAVTLGPLPMDIVNGSFFNGLTGWTVSESGGGANPGQVLPDNGEALMLEGDSFLVMLQQTFLVPTGAELLRFHLIVDPGFDETDDFIPDAFEASLLGAGNAPVVPAWDPFATSFFNMQEDGTMNLGSTTNWDGLTATVDISGVPAGTEVTLFFDFIGGDADTAGGLRIDNVFALEPVVICGDGIIVAPEECDDGNPDDGDGCSSTCTVETGWDCTGAPSACTEVCGDGIIVGSEECDDGNPDDGDGCSSTCTVEAGWDCTGEPSACTEVCGDGIIVGSEECDDGNPDDGDGCSSNCTVEAGWDCTGEPSACTAVCGDGIILGSEECDDGNPDDGDGCSSNCRVEAGWDCTGEPSACTGVCGDGIILGAEECDDGNLDNGDGCSSICAVEDGCACIDEPSMCACPPVVPPDPLNREKNRYISFNPNNAGRLVKFKVTLTDSVPHPGLIGSSWWVKPPVVPEPGEFPRPALGAGECVATLGSEVSAAEIDWDAAGCQTLHVTGCPIEPTSEYDVRAVAGANETEPLTVITILMPCCARWWGDTVGTFNGTEWTAPQGVTNIDDAVVAIKTFQGGPLVPPGPIPPGNVAHLSIADVHPGDINSIVNFNDVFLIILAFQGEMYPFGPADADGNCP